MDEWRVQKTTQGRVVKGKSVEKINFLEEKEQILGGLA